MFLQYLHYTDVSTVIHFKKVLTQEAVDSLYSRISTDKVLE